MKYRTERDMLGEKKISKDVYWGINTQRAIENFQVSGYHFDLKLIEAYAYVKKAAASTNYELDYLSEEQYDAITKACDEIIAGNLTDQFVLDPYCGGAGTSLNMNLNEVIANRALAVLGKEKGDYNVLSPLDHVNLHQSTNDTFPSALKLASLFYINELEESVTKLLQTFQNKEKGFSSVVKLGRTEMQEAVPMTLGAEFSGFSELIAQDRWRISKTKERLRVINLGGTAVGTGLAAPRDYIFMVTDWLKELSGLNLCRCENVVYATQNCDAIVESSGILKTYAVSLNKICSDLRTLNMLDEINLPALQAGSSIMPGKVNPVIAESVIQAMMKVCSNDSVINESASRGTLQINEFMPLIAHSFLESLRLLVNSTKMMIDYIAGIEANEEKAKQYLDNSPMIMTAFVPQLGYKKVQSLVSEFNCRGSALGAENRESRIENRQNTVRDFLVEKLGEEIVNETLSPENLTKLGF